MTVNPLLFWGICAMAAVGFVQAVLTKLKRDPTSVSPFRPEAPSEAPEGFVWVLVPERHASRAETLFNAQRD